MKVSSKLTLPTMVLIAGLLFACGGSEDAPLPSASTPAEYVTTDSLSKIRFADGQVSLNDRCPVRKVSLNLRMPAVYVNGHPVGFC